MVRRGGRCWRLRWNADFGSRSTFNAVFRSPPGSVPRPTVASSWQGPARRIARRDAQRRTGTSQPMGSDDGFRTESDRGMRGDVQPLPESCVFHWVCVHLLSSFSLAAQCSACPGCTLGRRQQRALAPERCFRRHGQWMCHSRARPGAGRVRWGSDGSPSPRRQLVCRSPSGRPSWREATRPAPGRWPCRVTPDAVDVQSAGPAPPARRARPPVLDGRPVRRGLAHQVPRRPRWPARCAVQQRADLACGTAA